MRLRIILGMTANVFGMTGSASLAKETGAIALTFLPAWVMSLVVPAMSLTIARFSLSRALSNVLLPALGLPMMATLTPFLITFPN